MVLNVDGKIWAERRTYLSKLYSFSSGYLAVATIQGEGFKKYAQTFWSSNGSLILNSLQHKLNLE